jgi:2-iminoacetate synthase ThiH
VTAPSSTLTPRRHTRPPPQEVIVQNFRAKKQTAMEHHPEPPLEELLWTVAAARLVLPRGVALQAPPNLTPESALLAARPPCTLLT